MSPDGLVPEPLMEAVTEQQAQALKVSEKVPLGRVADFRIRKEVLAEARKGRCTFVCNPIAREAIFPARVFVDGQSLDSAVGLK